MYAPHATSCCTIALHKSTVSTYLQGGHWHWPHLAARLHACALCIHTVYITCMAHCVFNVEQCNTVQYTLQMILHHLFTCAHLPLFLLLQLFSCFLVPLSYQAMHQEVAAIRLHQYWLFAGCLLCHICNGGNCDGSARYYVLQAGAAVVRKGGGMGCSMMVLLVFYAYTSLSVKISCASQQSRAHLPGRSSSSCATREASGCSIVVFFLYRAFCICLLLTNTLVYTLRLHTDHTIRDVE